MISMNTVDRIIKASVQPELKLTAIVAASKNGVIGVGKKLPWRSKVDLARFKEVTTNHVVIMGARTYLGLTELEWGEHGMLPGRDIIVIYTVRATKPDDLVTEMAEAHNKLYSYKIRGRFRVLPVLQKDMISHVSRSFLHDCLARDINSFKLPLQEAFVCGGSQIYELLYPLITHFDVTIIEKMLAKSDDEVRLGGCMGYALSQASTANKVFEFEDNPAGLTGTVYKFKKN